VALQDLVGIVIGSLAAAETACMVPHVYGLAIAEIVAD